MINGTFFLRKTEGILHRTYIPKIVENKFGRIENLPYICSMRNTLLHITAQYSENYGTPENPYWKPKGGCVFSLNVDSYIFMYAEEQAIEALKTLVANQSNGMCEYEYLSHELIFSGITALNDEEFEAEVQKVCEQKG